MSMTDPAPCEKRVVGTVKVSDGSTVRLNFTSPASLVLLRRSDLVGSTVSLLARRGGDSVVAEAISKRLAVAKV